MSAMDIAYFGLANSGIVRHNPLAFSAVMSDESTAPDFESLVSEHYRSLYQFGLSLTRSEAEASDLAQQTFYIWAKKGHQLRDASKVKTWLFTTLHREFLKSKRRSSRFPHQGLEEVERELPAVDPAMVNALDGQEVLAALGRVNRLYQAPVALFYLKDLSYKEIAEVLDVPIGTVQSRIARGKAELQQMLLGKEHSG
jgi:RNA polymerase sigma-70 factor, ECF subfamily